MWRFAWRARDDKPRPGRAGHRRLSLGAGFPAVVLACVGVVLCGARPVAGQIAPDADWQTLRTEHFAVTFQAGSEALGQRAAARAEAAYRELSPFLPAPTGERIELLVTEDADFSNGYASVTPARRIVIYARPPVDGFALAHFDDWLDLVITHELAHIFHLDVTGGLGGVLRRLFGRLPAPWPFFPGIGTPRWTIEGLATWYESELTGWGRTRGTFFEMMLRTAALDGAFAPIDRATGESPQWPAGEVPYLYGSLFFEYLLERYGPERMAVFVDVVAGQWIPYRLNAASREAFGVPFSEAWESWAESVREASQAVADGLWANPGPAPDTLTRDGRRVHYPVAGGDGSLFYARADGHSDAQIRRRNAEGDRFLARTNGISVMDVGPDGEVVFGQPEYRDPYRIYSDLWQVTASGEVQRLTRGQRLDHPTVSPRGDDVVAIRYQGTGAHLVRVVPGGEGVSPVTPAGSETWAFPAYSPDGRWIAATRWRSGEVDVVILEAATGTVILEVTRDRALDLAPVWSPDGGTLLWGSDRSGIPQIVAASVDPAAGTVEPRQAVTRVVSGAAFPTVDPAGDWLYFSLYTSLGWELARVPYEPDAWQAAPPPDPRFLKEPPPRPTPAVEGVITGYAAAPSLRPRFWEPLVLPGEDSPDGRLLGPFVGFSTYATDLVDRHALAIQGAVSVSGRQLDGRLQYRYAGLGNPVLEVSAEQEWDAAGPFVVQPEGAAEPERFYIREREQRFNLGATLLRERWYSRLELNARAGMVWESRRLLDRRFETARGVALNRPDGRLAEGQASVSWSTARGYALSLGPEAGYSLFVRGRIRSEMALPDSAQGVPGLDRSTDEVLGQLQFYQSLPLPGYADHVVAVRVAGGAARGPGADAVTFEVGGTRGAAEALTGLSLFGGSAFFFPVRGYENGERSGRYAWSGTAEYRFPLALVNRGWGLFPLHVDQIHGAVFLDAGNAWGPELGIPGYEAPRTDLLWSSGVELTVRALAFYNAPLALRAGWVRPGPAPTRLATSRWYLRLGVFF